MFIKIITFIWAQKRKHKNQVIAILLLLLLSAGLADIFAPYVFSKFVDKLQAMLPGQPREVLIQSFGLLFVAYMLARYLSTTAWMWMRKHFSYVEAKTLEDTENRIRSLMFEKSMNFFNTRYSGAITTKETKFTRSYERLFDEFIFSLWPTTWRLLGVITILLFVAPMFAWIFLVYVVIYLTFTTLYSRYKLKYDEYASKMTSKMTGRIADIYTNILAIKLFASERFEQERFEQENAKRFAARMQAWRLGNIRDNIVSFFNDTVMIIIMGGALLSWNAHSLTGGEVVLLFTYSVQVRLYMHWLGNSIKNSMTNYADMTEMMHYMDRKAELLDPVTPEPCKIHQGSIEFKNMSFSYPGSTRKIFDNFSLSIPAGQKIGLVGHSGSGKSTLISLLPRLYDITSGDIVIDGQSIKSITQHDLRRNISLISQEPVLFHRTIKEIIQYDKFDATDDEIVHAAKLACAHDFIMHELEKGYDTIVGERGVMLSGGQKQRVAIARALLEKTPILILDEATSAMDAIAEKEIQHALESLLLDKVRTMVVIAHRLSTVMHLDRVIVLDAGRIIEDGTPSQLLEQQGEFYRLWRAQQNLETLRYQLQLLTDKEKISLFTSVSDGDHPGNDAPQEITLHHDYVEKR